MFTGLVEEIGMIQKILPTNKGMKISVCCKKVLEDVTIGDSIAVNGVCLTVVEFTKDFFVVEVMQETIDKTTISSFVKGTYVNLERSLAVGQRMGGHYVQGHVDGTSTIVDKQEVGDAILFRFQVKDSLTQWMVEKGSIAVDGISLTLIAVGEDFFTVSIIPHTLHKTTLGYLTTGSQVNIECDILGKYIAKWAAKKEDIHV